MIRQNEVFDLRFSKLLIIESFKVFFFYINNFSFYQLQKFQKTLERKLDDLRQPRIRHHVLSNTENIYIIGGYPFNFGVQTNEVPVEVWSLDKRRSLVQFNRTFQNSFGAIMGREFAFLSTKSFCNTHI